MVTPSARPRLVSPQPYRAGIAYFIIVFIFAFAMGVLRTIIVVPAVGPTIAVMIEVPIVILLSWQVARRIVDRFALMGSGSQALCGLVAFVLLMMAEMLLAQLLNGQSAMQWARSLLTVAGMIGFAGQIIFALMPLADGN